MADSVLRNTSKTFAKNYAQSTKDFISKFEIALKECNESEYWLELLCETGSLSLQEFETYKKRVHNTSQNDRFLCQNLKKQKLIHTRRHLIMLPCFFQNLLTNRSTWCRMILVYKM
jgi:four helix bundle protein